MNNFASIFEELSKLYEEEVHGEPITEEKVEEACTEELTEAAEDEVAEDDVPAEEVPAEEPIIEDEPRRVILECDNCGAITIRDEADVVVDEETDLANVEDTCEYCDEAKGHKIVGIVAPYDVVDEEATEEEVAVDEEAPIEDEELEELLDVSIPVNVQANDNEVAVGGATV